MKRMVLMLTVVSLAIFDLVVGAAGGRHPAARDQVVSGIAAPVLVAENRSVTLEHLDRGESIARDGAGPFRVKADTGHPIQVVSEDGRVVLKGAVASPAERAAVESRVAREVVPFDVYSELTVDPLLDLWTRERVNSPATREHAYEIAQERPESHSSGVHAG